MLETLNKPNVKNIALEEFESGDSLQKIEQDFNKLRSEIYAFPSWGDVFLSGSLRESHYSITQLLGTVVMSIYDKEEAEGAYGSLKEKSGFYSENRWNPVRLMEGVHHANSHIMDFILQYKLGKSPDASTLFDPAFYSEEGRKWSRYIKYGSVIDGEGFKDDVMGTYALSLFDMHSAREMYYNVKHNSEYSRKEPDPQWLGSEIHHNLERVIMQAQFDPEKALKSYKDIKRLSGKAQELGVRTGTDSLLLDIWARYEIASRLLPARDQIPPYPTLEKV